MSQVAPIVLEGLTKRYGNVKAVEDLSFAVRAGGGNGFLGPNGPSTALRVLRLSGNGNQPETTPAMGVLPAPRRESVPVKNGPVLTTPRRR
jgi:ABC-2 type transport system ATP-binding protein